MSYIQWQIEKHGNYVGADGLLHNSADTHHMVDDDPILFVPVVFEDKISEQEAFSRKLDQMHELFLIEGCK